MQLRNKLYQKSQIEQDEIEANKSETFFNEI